MASALTLASAADCLIGAVQDLSLARSLDDVTSVVRKAARVLADADGATFVLLEGDQCYYVDEEAIAPLWKGHRFPASACVSGWVIHHRQPVLIPDITTDERVPQDAYRRTFVKSLAMVPIRSLSPVGAVGVYWARPSQPTAAVVRLIQALADSAAVALEVVKASRELGDSDSGGTSPARMCAWTRQFEWNGEWMPLEAYLLRRFGIAVSHCISPLAVAALQNEMHQSPTLAKPEAAAKGETPRNGKHRDGPGPELA
jgi:hypothetical protein